MAAPGPDPGCWDAARRHPLLVTERLTLRPPADTDLQTVLDLAGDAAVATMTARIPHPLTRDDAAAWLAARGGAWDGRRGEAVFAIERRADGRMLGMIGLEVDDPAAGGQVGYWLGRPFWGHGYMTEALVRLLRFAFTVLELPVVRGDAFPDNARSMRVQEKAGMAAAGRDRIPAPARGGDREVVLYAIDRESWERANPRPLVLVAAVALIDADGRVLVAQRPEGKAMAGLWEFPGGKVHDGETPEAALIRELKEELAIDITESCLAPLVFASHAYDDFHLLMPLYACRVWKGTVTAVEGQALKWVRPTGLAQLPMPPADEPLVALLRDFL